MSRNQNSSREQGVEKYFYRASAVDFKKIPSNPIAYWAREGILESFDKDKLIEDVAQVKIGMGTGRNAIFVRNWWEVGQNLIDFSLTDVTQLEGSKARYFPYNKGGDFRLWYGNQQHVLWFDSAGRNYMDTMSGHRENGGWSHYFRQGLTWSFISSSKFGIRFLPTGFAFDVAGSTLFLDARDIKYVLGFLSSVVCFEVLALLNPTLNYQAGNLKSLPIKVENESRGKVEKNVDSNISCSRSDWNAYETSWDFTAFQLLHPDYRQSTLQASYQSLRTHWREMTLEMQRLEEDNNRIFIDAYGLEDELTPEVPLAEITLTCNPHYRYGGDKSEDELEALLLADTMRELVSYAVGCMFGRYSLDKPGLILANQGDTLADYLAQAPQPRFPADDDNVIPMLDGDWFPDDVTLRVRQFLRVAFGDAHYEDNLAFIEQALNIKGKRNYGLRDYLLGEFYAEHVKRYKKRPIYWLFSSPKGSFNALIYMHRYRPDTVSVVLRYLRDYREKLVTEKERQAAISINPAISQGDKTRALKETDRLAKVLAELEGYERDVLYPLATQQVPIDLDDGVKVNYLKFEGALKKIPGLAAKDED
ncbi:BREX-1 system adenine-specific DNA-methyltransferase PglX [Stenotrophomonas sp. Marseille-Q4652]|uniref:BREX-1 system adenine-specific DNA-methyltransferase PglX n=1 Tax=Stenotrophomonas sp. Marseille-Q4652 TaxID=2866595 RepID=UPI001CE470F2|nr:BREX-1 system adenine-specific DNA-methyltransferase PglX [Stenotrophomonas sp. Marseille-Q4652]